MHNQCYSNGPFNLHNLGSNKETQPESIILAVNSLTRHEISNTVTKCVDECHFVEYCGNTHPYTGHCFGTVSYLFACFATSTLLVVYCVMSCI